MEPDRYALAPGLGSVPPKLSARVWVTTWVAFVVVNLITWTYVHTYADTRQCVAHLPDPLFTLIAHNDGWYWITGHAYHILTPLIVVVLLAQAIFRQEHRPLLRWGLAMALMGVMRDITIVLLPLCRMTVDVGTAAISEPHMINLGLFEVPWRMFAANDLVFSGHVGGYILFLRVAGSWPRWSRILLWTFQLLQAYGLLATRGHYTVDILLAIPCAYMADHFAMSLMRTFAGERQASAEAVATHRKAA